jgi:hypothetical protein
MLLWDGALEPFSLTVLKRNKTPVCISDIGNLQQKLERLVQGDVRKDFVNLAENSDYGFRRSSPQTHIKSSYLSALNLPVPDVDR